MNKVSECIDTVEMVCCCGKKFTTVKLSGIELSGCLCDECREKQEHEEMKTQKHEYINKCNNILERRFGVRYREADFKHINTNYFENRNFILQTIPFLQGIADSQYYIISLVGDRGTGKTYLAACIIRQYLENRQSWEYKYCKPFLDKYKSYFWGNSIEKHEIADEVKKMKKAKILILDEIDKIKSNTEDISILYDIINERYNNLLKTVLIGNVKKGVDSFEKIFGYSLADRINSVDSKVIYFSGESIRQRM